MDVSQACSHCLFEIVLPKRNQIAVVPEPAANLPK
jgi:hypothetical protein